MARGDVLLVSLPPSETLVNKLKNKELEPERLTFASCRVRLNLSVSSEYQACLS